MSVRRGVRLGVDVGDVRIGVASCDRDGLIATPLETVAAGDGSLDRLVALVAEHEPIELVVGLPRSMSGGLGPAAVKVGAYARTLAARVDPLPVRLVDERLSTVSADRQLRGRVRGRARREVIDQAAAVVILQTALDTERTSGRVPGEPVAAEDA